MHEIIFLIGLIIFLATGLAIFLIFAGYPLFLLLLVPFVAKKREIVNNGLPAVTMLTVVRNGEALIRDKLDNFLGLDYPPELLELLVVSDGSTDATETVVKEYSERAPRIRLLSLPDHQGKTAGINLGAPQARGEFIVFSDVDAILDPDAVGKLVRYFNIQAIGGVSGRRVLEREKVALRAAQQIYFNFDTLIKRLESRVGSISANDGKLYAIRKILFTPVPDSVTDDLYQCLSIVSMGYQFVFEPAAIARVRTPSRNAAHEIRRRRRIVSRSLNGISLMRKVFNGLQFGQFSFGLLVNKVLRRLLPFFLIGFFLSSLLLGYYHRVWAGIAAIQTLFYLVAILFIFFPAGSLPSRICSPFFYFTLGNYATLLGVIDYFRGNLPTGWEPEKTA